MSFGYMCSDRKTGEEPCFSLSSGKTLLNMTRIFLLSPGLPFSSLRQAGLVQARPAKLVQQENYSKSLLNT